MEDKLDTTEVCLGAVAWFGTLGWAISSLGRPTLDSSIFNLLWIVCLLITHFVGIVATCIGIKQLLEKKGE